MSTAILTTLIKALQNPSLFDHDVQQFETIDTHISTVLLTGEYAYKFKKPLDFGFLDFSSLEKRKQYCEAEVKLNRLLAPSIYLNVVPITGTIENPVLNGEGKILEYAIRMREFSQEQLCNQLITKNTLERLHIIRIAKALGHFHQKTEVAESDTPYGTPDFIQAPVIQNFDQIEPLLTCTEDHPPLQTLRAWSETMHQKLLPWFIARKKNGYIRACHGDVHLGNIVLMDNKPVIFDCIEFNEAFRWTDTMGDLGFLSMDLDDYGKFDYAQCAINAYLQTTGDVTGLYVLRYYQAYRAIVRAKIAIFQLQQNGLSLETQKTLRARYTSCINRALAYKKESEVPFRTLIIMHGFSGSGKSTLANAVAEKIGAIVWQSDAERKRIAGFTIDTVTHSPIGEGIYNAEWNAAVYERLYQLAEATLDAGYPVIIDATFLKQNERLEFASLAKKKGVPFYILDCATSEKMILDHLAIRTINDTNISEAGINVLNLQRDASEPLNAIELAATMTIDIHSIDDEKIQSLASAIFDQK